MSGTITAVAVVAVLVLIAFVVMRSRKRQPGEWDAAPRQSKRQLFLGILVLLVAIAGLGYTNRLV